MKRSILLTLIFTLTGIIFIARLFYLQVLENPYKIPTIYSSAVKVKFDYPERGYIYDRNGNLMVANQPSYDIMVIPGEVKLKDTLEFCQLLKISKKKFIDKQKKAWNYSTRIPSIFVPQVSKVDFGYLQEKMHKYEGFYIQKRSLREYPLNSSSNILGYISEVDEQLIQEKKEYQLGELIGTAGVEKTYEKELRGTKGVRFFQRDRFNKIIGPYKKGIYDTLPSPGKDITLTVDSNLQKYGEQLMQNKRGGIVALEPSSGEILALISAPTYNPNMLVGRKRSQNFTKLYLDTINKPLFDRGLQGEYPPGSPFKSLTALIALQEGAIDEKTSIRCSGGYRYGKKSTEYMECHCGKKGENFKLHKAIYKSCNTYFANAYRKTIEKFESPSVGIDTWKNHLESFGLGNYLNNDLSVGKKGLIPGSKLYDRWYSDVNWQATYTISNSIGQGEVLTTPIQLANMTAAIANRGHYFTPHIVKEIDGKEIDLKFKTPKETSIDKAYFNPIIDGLFSVLEHEEGTARFSRVKGIEICGKTGTAENPHGQDHSIFIAFAPKDDPKIALAVFVENGYWGSRWAGPIASLMIEKYLTGNITNTSNEKRMLNGSLEDEYEKQYQEKLLKLEKRNE
jgi:penicillin-binding protein 2